jgi:hypothetical protein
LRVAMLGRLTRALDHPECAQQVLHALESEVRRGCSAPEALSEAMAAVKLLARRWPQDHLAGAVEWRLLGDAEME